MKAPDKIYLQVCGDCSQSDCDDCNFEDLEDNITWCKDRIFEKDVEYIRADAFIEKVKSFLNKKNDRDYYTIGYIKRHLKYIIKEVGL